MYSFDGGSFGLSLWDCFGVGLQIALRSLVDRFGGGGILNCVTISLADCQDKVLYSCCGEVCENSSEVV